jgi:hypothetical protein
MPDDDAELMTDRAAAVSRQVQELFHGLDSQVQGAILGDLVSLWLAGHWEPDELATGKAGKLTVTIRSKVFVEWCKVVWLLVPESEAEIMMHRLKPQ